MKMICARTMEAVNEAFWKSGLGGRDRQGKDGAIRRRDPGAQERGIYTGAGKKWFIVDSRETPSPRELPVWGGG